MLKKKNNRSNIFLFVALNLFLQISPAQQSKIDSLIHVLKKLQPDTNKVNTLNELAWEFRNHNPDTSIILSNQALLLVNALQNITKQWKQIATCNCLNQLGEFNWRKSNYPQALDYYFKSLELWDLLEEDPSVPKSTILKGKSVTLTNIGIVHRNQGDYPKALNYYFIALKNFEKLDDRRKVAVLHGNIGGVYYNLKDFDKALDYHLKALKTFEELKDKYRMAISLGNIGLDYRGKNNYEKALDHYLKALQLAEETENPGGIAMNLDNIANIYKDQKDFDKAINYYLKALKINTESGNKINVSINLSNIGILYAERDMFNLAESYLKKGLSLSKEIGDLQGLMENHQNLSLIYEELGKHKLTYKHYVLYITYRDSLQNEEKVKKQTRLEMQYDFDKKQMADSIKNAEHIIHEELKHEQEINQQKTYTYGGAIGFLLMVVVAGVSFRAFKQKQRSNKIILYQKNLVEEKQKEILDSIHYAKRIQKSLLPTEKYIERNLKGL